MPNSLPLSLETILKISGGELANADSFTSAAAVSRISTLGQAGVGDLAFFFSKEYQSEIMTARPSILITAPPFVGPLKASGLPIWKSAAIVACADPYLAMAELSRFFAGEDANEANGVRRAKSEIHPSAVIASDVKLGERVLIGPYVVVESGCTIGDDTTLSAHTTLGANVKIGARTKLFAGVHVYPGVAIGSDVRVHSDTVIGSDGFGYAPKKADGKIVEQMKIYHLGTVIIEDRVEIGASVTIDRATFGATKICKGAKLDNKVHIGHNCTVGEGAILCGALALAGGVEIGRFAYVGGLTGITNRVKIGDGAMIGALSLVSKDVAAGDSMVGNPARPSREHFKIHAMMNRMLDKKKE